MSTEVTIGANPNDPDEVYIGLQNAITLTVPDLTAWQPAGNKSQGQIGTYLEGTDLDV